MSFSIGISWAHLARKTGPAEYGHMSAYGNPPGVLDPPCNCLALRQASRRITRLYDQALMPIGLRATQYSLLCQIAHLGPIALNPLAETLVMDRATLGHNIRPLEARGLIRIAVGQDRRSRDVSVTKAGRQLIVRGHKPWQQAQNAFEAEISRETAAALRTILHRVAATEFALR
jgi:DNA-binding MarR family transcriptional regulator